MNSIMVLILTPKPAFLALTDDQRMALLQNIASPIQEFTGAAGGVFFSERVSFSDGNWGVMIAVRASDASVAYAFMDALKRPEFQDNFVFTGVTGEELGLHRPEEGPAVLQRILKPFLD